MSEVSSDRQPWPSAAYGWYVVAILCLCNMVAFVDRQIINLLVEDIKADLAITDTEISLLQGLAFAVFYAVTAVPLGRLADTANRRWIISTGILIWTVAAASCGLARSFWQLFIARMFVGVGEATLTPSGFSMLADLFNPKRVSLPISVFTGSTFVGSGIALLAGGFVWEWKDHGLRQTVDNTGRDKSRGRGGGKSADWRYASPHIRAVIAAAFSLEARASDVIESTLVMFDTSVDLNDA